MLHLRQPVGLLGVEGIARGDVALPGIQGLFTLSGAGNTAIGQRCGERGPDVALLFQGVPCAISALALEAGSTEVDLGEPPDLKLQNLIANQTDDVAGVLRSWLNESDELASR